MVRTEPRQSLIPNAVAVSGGWGHSLAIRSDGIVWAWGANWAGQLGDGTNSRSLAPVVVSGLSDVVAVAAGGDHSLALKSDGTVWAWGDNYFGQLGDGSNSNRNVPVQVPSLSDVVAVAAGGRHSLAVKSDGTVWAWGENFFGQLGDGSNSRSPVPVAVSGLSDVVAIAAGYAHSLALKSDGTVWAWGDNWSGQLGDGTNTTRNVPVAVSGLTDVVAIAAGYGHSLALKSDGTVWAWGDNWSGQLGDGTNSPSLVPVAVSGLSGVVAVAAGSYHSLAVMSDGTVWAWGDNDYGQLGDGSNSRSPVPVAVFGLSDVVAIAGGYGHSLALTSDGTVWAWGTNSDHQLGNGTDAPQYVPGAVSGVSEAVAIAAGGRHSLAVSSTRTAALTVPTLTANAGALVSLAADLFSLSDPMPSRTLAFDFNLTPAGAADTGSSGTATVAFNIPSDTPTGFYPVDVYYWGDTDLLPCRERGWVFVVGSAAPTSTVAEDTTGTITESVTLRGYLKRTSDNAWLDGKTIEFRIDGTLVGTAVTGATGTPGRADLNWVITDGPATRTIGAAFAGDAGHLPSSGTATLTAQSWTTRMATFARTQRIGGMTELKARLVRSDSVPIAGKPINFYVDGTFVIAQNTDAQGYARYPSYVVPDGAGAGTRTILSEWVGNGGYAPISRTATLTVQKALPYIWVMPRSVPQGGTAALYAYFRRTSDLQAQEGKTLSFKVDGTWIADVATGAGANAGIARYNYNTSGLSVGSHTVRCEFAGDAWVDAGFGIATLTIN
jgi:alpha-tubulin suppressor-like RCC1 family protein